MITIMFLVWQLKATRGSGGSLKTRPLCVARTGLGNGNIGHSRLDTRRREACGYRTNKVLSTAGHKFEPGFVALIQPLTLHRYDAYLCPAVLSGLVFGMPGILRQRRTCHLWQ